MPACACRNVGQGVFPAIAHNSARLKKQSSQLIPRLSAIPQGADTSAPGHVLEALLELRTPQFAGIFRKDNESVARAGYALVAKVVNASLKFETATMGIASA